MKYSLVLIFILASCSKLPAKFRPSAPKKVSKVFNVSWIKELDPPYEAGNLPIGNGSPLIHNDKVFFANKNGSIRSYSLKDGRQNWDFDENLSLTGAHATFKDNIIYTSYSGRVFSRNYTTGELVYSIDLKAPIEYPPLIHMGRAVFHMRNHQLVCLDASTGKIMWVYKRAIPFSTTLQKVSVPVAKDNKVIVGFADGSVAAFEINDGSVIWDKRISTGPKFIDVDVKALIVGNLIYAGSSAGQFTILDSKTGAIIRSVAFQASSGAKLINGKVYVGSEDGDIYELDRNGNIIKQVNIYKKGISSLEKWKDVIIATTYGNKVFALDQKTLEIRDEFDLGSVHSAVFGEITTDTKFLSIYSSRNRLYLFK